MLPESAPVGRPPVRRSAMGRQCLVRDKKWNDRVFVGARVIDCVGAEQRLAKRVRLLTGEHAGEVLMPGEYDLMEFTD